VIDPEEPKQGFTIDELEAASGVPSRTIRFYRQSGLIDAPRRHGRRAFYDADQLDRLVMITGLRERGLGLDAIRKVIDDPDDEQQAWAGLLQIGDELRKPWIEDRTAVLSELEVQETAGTDEAVQIEMLEAFGIISRTRPRSSSYQVPSVALLQLAGDIIASGFEPALAFAAWQAMQDALAPLARDLVKIFTQPEPGSLPDPPNLDELREGFEQLRPIALQAVQLSFAHEIERALEQFVEQGGVFEMKTMGS
jgi:DNA-binding transcriptional MerR regulator